MHARNCCKTMELELTAWKAVVYDILRKMESMPGEEKVKILSHLEDIHILVEDMDNRIEEIRETCTPETGIDDIKTEREQHNRGLEQVRMKVEDAMRVMSAGDFGG